MLKITDLSKTYLNGETALSKFNLEINSKITSLLGYNGSGKTTLMKIISGVLTPTTGKVEIFGHSPYSFRQFMGYMPEENFLPPFLTGGEFLMFCCRLYGMPKSQAKEKIKTSLGILKSLPLKNKLVKNMSSGNKRKLLLIQAFIHQPKLVILDEPSVYLDAKSKEFMRYSIECLPKSSMVLISSHILSEIEEIADTLIILRQGKLIKVLNRQDIAQKGQAWVDDIRKIMG